MLLMGIKNKRQGETGTKKGKASLHDSKKLMVVEPRRLPQGSSKRPPTIGNSAGLEVGMSPNVKEIIAV